jgi:hypothetical protein
MDTETDHERPGRKRARILDWIPWVEYCPKCAANILWHERITANPDLVKKQRFRRCCVCAAAKSARERRVEP